MVIRFAKEDELQNYVYYILRGGRFRDFPKIYGNVHLNRSREDRT